MKVLVLSITAGEGHNATARAISEVFTEKGVESHVLDTYAYINKALANVFSKGYLFVSKDAKLIWSGTYRLIENRRAGSDTPSATRSINKVFIRKMGEYIAAEDPDAIVYTHSLVGIILDLLKQKGKLRAKTIGIVTDFTMHPFWEESLHSDYIVTACEQLEYQAMQKGFRPEQILPLGIPTNPKFSKSVPKEEARRQLGLDPDKKTILFMGGSMGYGNMSKTVKQLDKIDEDFQIIAVCGNNDSAKRKVEALRTEKRVLALGFANNVDLLMDASDCIITKPGGLTTSETLAKRLPMIIVNPIPGQEVRNSEFLVNHGAAMQVSSTMSLEEIIYTMTKNPAKLEQMRENIDLIRKPTATEDLCNFVMDVCK